MNKEYSIIVNDMLEERLDKYLAVKFKEKLSRAQIKKIINDRQLKVNGLIKVQANYQVKKDDVISFVHTSWETSNSIKKDDLPLNIVYEDNDILVINKPNNLVVHPGTGNKSQTLVNALAFYFDDEDFGNENRAGLVHRIDKQTTGLLVVAKNKVVLDYLQNLLKQHKIKRTYIAVVKGNIKENNGRIEAPIGRDRSDRKKMAVTAFNSKQAITNFKVLKRLQRFTVIECQLETGRTHQIRVHLAYIKHPIVGDYIYGQKSNYDVFGQYLHAYKLELTHPVTKKNMIFNAELPKEFYEFITQDDLKYLK